MRRLVGGLIVVLAVAQSTGAESKLRKPRLDLRATPRVAFSPAYVLLTAELVGGDEVEELYCPGLEWNWGDGGRSVRESANRSVAVASARVNVRPGLGDVSFP